MNSNQFVDDYIAHFVTVLRGDGALAERLREAKAALEETAALGGRVMLAGNGASASMASHYALDFTKQAGVPSVSFNDAPLLTAYANDYGYEDWVARAVEHHGRPGDAAVLISSSGRSPNMVNAADACRALEIKIITFTGFDESNPVKTRGHVNFWVESRAYNIIENVHATWLGLLCDLMIGKREYDVSS